MRDITNNKTMFLIVTLTLLIHSPAAFAYPPDNAAVLYYRACQWYQSDSEMDKMLYNLSRGKIEVDGKIKKYVRKNRRAIDFSITAAEVPNCDWGMDYSKGMSMVMPPLVTFRNLARLIMADAKILANQGDYRLALGRCLSLKKFARHVSDRPQLMYLVGNAINDMSNRCIQDILAEIPENLQTLSWLKKQLLKIENTPLSFKTCIDYGDELLTTYMTKEAGKTLMVFAEGASSSIAKIASDRIRAADEAFFEKNRMYWENHIAHVRATLDLPHPEAYARLKKLSDKPEKDAVENPDATLTAILVPELAEVYRVGIRGKTISNAIKAAIDIYIIRAKTGQLPDALPKGLPKDLFSGKDFEYKKTKDGFVLRCRDKDLVKNINYEYEFKVNK